MNTDDPAAWASLAGHHYLNLTTFRRDGRAVPTAIWFAEVDGRLVFTTAEQSGKFKRIRRTPRVLIAPSDARGGVLGPVLHGQAQLLDGPAADQAHAALERKYGYQFRIMAMLTPLLGQHVFMAITLAPEAAG